MTRVAWIKIETQMYPTVFAKVEYTLKTAIVKFFTSVRGTKIPANTVSAHVKSLVRNFARKQMKRMKYKRPQVSDDD